MDQHFASPFFRQTIIRLEKKRRENSKRPTKFVVLDMSLVSHIDASALRFLSDLQTYFKAKDVTLCLSGISQEVMDRLINSGLTDKIGHKNIFVGIHEAVYSCRQSMPDVDVEDPKNL